jgi:hypothetical protein
MTTQDYIDAGFANRKEYLNSLAEDYGLPIKSVYAAASMLGAEEDFDALVFLLEDYSLTL